MSEYRGRLHRYLYGNPDAAPATSRQMWTQAVLVSVLWGVLMYVSNLLLDRERSIASLAVSVVVLALLCRGWLAYKNRARSST